jgi:AbrB family looped-hinge helix DNA binding protein
MIQTTNAAGHANRDARSVAAQDSPDDLELPHVTARIWTKLGDGGRLVIPAEIRQELGMKLGDRLLLLIEDGELHVITVAQGVERAQKLAAPYIRPGVSMADELIAERRAEHAREEEVLRQREAAQRQDAGRE